MVLQFLEQFQSLSVLTLNAQQMGTAQPNSVVSRE